MLQVVAESVRCDACIVWRLVPGSDFDADPPQGQLFALAQWFRESEFWTAHDLSPLCATGQAIRARTPDLVNDIHHHEGVDPHDEFFTRTRMQRFCTVPLQFKDSWGALNVYRLADQDISAAEFAQVRMLAQFIPRLYRTIRDRAGFRLIDKVNDLLREAEAQREDPKQAMQRVCELVRSTFRCLETSVFLENPNQKPGVHHCYFTTEPTFVGDKVDYRPDEPGLTPWVLSHEGGIQLFDLRYFKRDAAWIHENYPGLEWEDRQEVVGRAAEDQLSGVRETRRTPVSFMAAPILIGPQVRGAIRCCLAVDPPYYFSRRELDLLAIVASRIGQYWGHRLALEQSQAEAGFWSSLAEGVRGMNSYVHRELSTEVPDRFAIYREAVKIISKVIPVACGSTVRLRDPERNDLYEVAPGGPGAVRRFPLTKPASSVGAAVCHEQKIKTVAREERSDYRAEFGDSRFAIVCPIWSGKETVGVLDIRSNAEIVGGLQLESLLELWARELGLYDHLAVSIAELRAVIEQQSQAYVDLEHQLAGPLLTALRRVQQAMEPDKDNADPLLSALRGQLRKVYRVSKNVPLFAALAKGQAPAVKPRRLERDDTVRRLIEYCQDFKIASRNRRVGFHVSVGGFDVLRNHVVEADPALFEQAANNVLDNAFKYIYSETEVRVHAGVEDRLWFFISVSDFGLTTAPGEVEQCKQRGHRGEAARSVTAEGSGIGLWIVDAIMKAHGGALDVIPTHKGVTEVRLRWRCRKTITS